LEAFSFDLLNGAKRGGELINNRPAAMLELQQNFV
jgi:hypothetical protein